jgi:acylphosphatase
MLTARKVFYSGRVQGVGFRWNAKHIAAGYEVVGFVRNLPDGRVELAIRGPAEEVEAYLEAVRQSGLAAHIETEVSEPWTDLPDPKTLKGFNIIA